MKESMKNTLQVQMIQETKNKGQLLFKLTKILGFLKGLQFS